ncbi:two-component system phosphate regulon sensor histidine kinase PhoR [Arthrobacter globiformis]|uniref:sensor histidine kinase n=1 Tax=Arthrobacter globiformis TaxID=1665 RepID=UPI00278867F6|nr:ATP-binding protein [Arthrobacter globiformis]MDQ1060021.1 two-component system phosphate regulon sensor histidine kinase PhoR [Arthrobacter globiformis]
MVQAPAEYPSAPREAVVALTDAARLASVASVLTHAGFTVRKAPDSGSLAQELEGNRPAVVLLDTALTDGYRWEGTPVLLLVDLAGDFDLAQLEPWGIADYISRDAAPPELTHRVETLIRRARERRRIRAAAEFLRESLRNVSAAIRGTNSPQQMAGHLVRGFGESLAVDHVWFTTFQDSRVPRISAQWSRPGHAKLPDTLRTFEDAAREQTTSLWSAAEALAVPDHRTDQSAALAEGLRKWSGLASVRASVCLPVGEGESALGVIWIAQLNEPRDWTRAEIALIQHVAGNLAHSLIQGHLISAQLQVLQQLRELDKAKTDFLATVNHELRTPLTSITAYLDMIRDGAGGPVPPGIESMMDVISRNSDRLRRLIEDMLTVSQQDGSGNLSLKQVELGQVLRIVVAALRPLADSRNVTITGADSHEDVKVQADEAQLEQVFTNIVANAIKFTPNGGRISISFMTAASEAGSPYAVVNVTDTGVGIPEQEIARVFTRFYRASNASSAAIPGSGLGLAIAHDIVRRHGGSLDLSSELGEGTIVSVRLPVDGPQAEETDDDEADGDEAAGAPQTD